MMATTRRVPFGDISNKENQFPGGVAMKKKTPVEEERENEFEQVRKTSPLLYTLSLYRDCHAVTAFSHTPLPPWLVDGLGDSGGRRGNQTCEGARERWTTAAREPAPIRDVPDRASRHLEILQKGWRSVVIKVVIESLRVDSSCTIYQVTSCTSVGVSGQSAAGDCFGALLAWQQIPLGIL